MRKKYTPPKYGTQRLVNTGALIQTTKKVGSLKPQFVGEIRLDPEQLANIMQRGGVVSLSGYKVSLGEESEKYLIKLRVTTYSLDPEERKRKRDHVEELQRLRRKRVEDREYERMLRALESSRVEALAYEERERTIFEVDDD